MLPFLFVSRDRETVRVMAGVRLGQDTLSLFALFEVTFWLRNHIRLLRHRIRANDSLRDTISKLNEQLSAASAETARKHAAAYQAVFAECVGRYRALGEICP